MTNVYGSMIPKIGATNIKLHRGKKMSSLYLLLSLRRLVHFSIGAKIFLVLHHISIYINECGLICFRVKIVGLI